MRIALCNEVLAGMSLERQCEYAAALGYDGLEIAPFTLSDAPEKISTAEAARICGIVEASGLVVTGLHWLLVKPDGLSLTDPDATLRKRTREVMTHLIGLCAELGGSVLVHGSPKQRQTAQGETHATALARLQDAMAQAALTAARAGVVYCIEPLSKRETSLVNTIAEAAELVRAIDHPNFRTMIDCSAAGQSEAESIPAFDRPLAADRPDCASAGQRSEPPRPGSGRDEIRADPRCTETPQLCRHDRGRAV